jgi:hypothetical protein
MIRKGDIVSLKTSGTYPIDLRDLMNLQHYSKYMLVLEIFSNTKLACKVLCANGEINWVAGDRLNIIERFNNEDK